MRADAPARPWGRAIDCEQRAEQCVGRDAVGERLVGQHHPVPQHVRASSARRRAGRSRGRAGTPAPWPPSTMLIDARGLAPNDTYRASSGRPDRAQVAGGGGEPHGVLDDLRVDVHGVGGALVRAQLLGVDHRLGPLRACGHPLDDDELLGRRGVADEHLEHEPVDLRLRQRVGALGLDRVLRGHDQERVGRRVGLAPDRDLALLHHLQQRALHLGRGAVDLVGEQQVGEHRPERDLELALALVVDPGADDVGGHQIGGELDPLELPADGLGQGLDRHRLGQPGHPLDQQVAAGQQGHEHPLEQLVLPDDGLLDLVQACAVSSGSPVVRWRASICLPLTRRPTAGGRRRRHRRWRWVRRTRFR